MQISTITTSGGFAPSFVLNILASRPASVVDEKTVTEHAKDGDLGNAWLGQNTAGTGPFALRAYKPNESIALRGTSFRDYRDAIAGSDKWLNAAFTSFFLAPSMSAAYEEFRKAGSSDARQP